MTHLEDPHLNGNEDWDRDDVSFGEFCANHKWPIIGILIAIVALVIGYSVSV